MYLSLSGAQHWAWRWEKFNKHVCIEVKKENYIRWLILYPNAKGRIWNWVAGRKLFPLSKNWLILISTRQDAQATFTLCCHPLTLTHSRFPEPPQEKKKVTCFGWNSMAKNFVTCHSFGGRAVNLTIVLVFCSRTDCLGWEEPGPSRRKWGFCK